MTGLAPSTAQLPARPRIYSGGTPVAEFGNVLEADGLHVALGWLNERTRFRFTGAFSDETGAQAIIQLFDRENPSVVYHGATDLPGRYSYCGTTLLDTNGVRVGTLSHYDHRPRIASDECRRLLRDVAPLVAAHWLLLLRR
ncbi:MAG: hypothetical protein JWM41_4803 [Gemmatimonadetes bacterium]|nr:hypothetical protein [Gemmatimonadota bacterium]